MNAILGFVVAIFLLFSTGECLNDKCWTCNPADCMMNEKSPEWKPFGDYLYALLEEQVFHHEGEKRCIELGGHLASIHSKEENDFIHKLRGNNSVWIGLNKTANSGADGTFVWTDGTNSNDFEPPWVNPNEKYPDCVYMTNCPKSTGGWSEYFCDQNLPIQYSPSPPFAVCKKSKSTKK